MEMLSAERFRKRLAGVVDKSKSLSEEESKDIKKAAINYCALLPQLFSEDFDRKTLWTRIGNGVIASIKKCGGDFEEFINLSLEFIKADPGKTAECKNLEMLLAYAETMTKEWKIQFLRMIEKKHNVILVYSRQQWRQKVGVK